MMAFSEQCFVGGIVGAPVCEVKLVVVSVSLLDTLALRCVVTLVWTVKKRLRGVDYDLKSTRRKSTLRGAKLDNFTTRRIET